MTTQYTSILKLALPVQGELSGTWGDVVNDNITSMVEEAVAGRAVINTWTTNSHTLTTADGTTSEARCAMLEFTDTGAALTGAATVVCPSASKLYVCKNDSGQQVTIQTAAGTGVAIPDGQTMFVFCDGTNVEQCETNFNSLSYNGYTLNFGGAVTTAGAFTTSGAYALTLTTTGATDVTLPTTGTLATLDGTETLTNKTLTAPTISSPSLTGSISATDLTISGNTTIGDAAADTLTVNGTITSNLIFTDDTYDIGATGATRPRNLFLSGNATIGGTVTLSGGIDVTGALGVDGDFDVNTDKFTVASATGNTLVAGTLGVTGITTATGGLNVDTISEITAAGGVTVDGVLLKDGGATLTGDLTVDTDTLYVDSASDGVGIGTTTISRKLNIQGDQGLRLFNDATDSYLDIDHGTDGAIIKQSVTTKDILFRGGTASGELVFETSSSEAMRIDTSQRVLIGLTSAIAVGSTSSAGLEVASTGVNSWISQTRFNNANSGPLHLFGKSRSATVGTFGTVVQDDDALGTLSWAGDDGTDAVSVAAQIQGAVDGTPGANDMPGRLVFLTTADGAAAPTERMRINSSGQVTVGVGTARGQLTISQGDNATATQLVIQNTDTTIDDDQEVNNLEFYTNDASAGGTGVTAKISQVAENPGSLYGLAFSSYGASGLNEAMRIDNKQRVLIGHNDTIAVGGESNPGLQLIGSGATSNSWMNMVRFSSNSGSSVLNFGKSRSDTIGTMTVVQDGDSLGIISANGADGGDMNPVAGQIRFEVDGTPGTNDMPGRIEFLTTADGGFSPTERMRITNEGYVGINSTNPEYMLDVVGSSGTNTIDSTTVNKGVRVRPNASGGLLEIDEASGNIYLHSGYNTGDMVFSTRNSFSNKEAMRIKADRKVLIGTSTDVGTGHLLQLNSDMTIMTFDGTTTGADGVRYIKSRATSVGSNAIVANGDDIGFLDFRADDGTDYASRTGIIASQVDGSPGVNDTPGRLLFYTTADGASSSTERMRIDSSGSLLVGTSTQTGSGRMEVKDNGNASNYVLRVTADDSAPYAFIVGNDSWSTSATDGVAIWQGSTGEAAIDVRGSSGALLRLRTRGTERVAITEDGITFNGDRAAANALDDYEEGTWTPTYSASGGGSYNTLQNTGFYTKIGNLVTVTWWTQFGNPTGTLSGNLQMSGLPFNSNGSTRASPSFRTYGWASGSNIVLGYTSGSAVINWQYYSSGISGTATNVPANWINNTGDELGGTLTYQIS